MIERVSAFLRVLIKPSSRGAMTIGAKSRQYYVYLPEAYGSRPLPVVMALHGYGTTATGLASAHEINPTPTPMTTLWCIPNCRVYWSPGRVGMIW